jgi:hypothetical protein
MNVIGRYNIVKHAQTITSTSLKQPIEPAPSVGLELKQKLFLMASLGDMPYLAGNEMPIRSSHSVPSLELLSI